MGRSWILGSAALVILFAVGGYFLLANRATSPTTPVQTAPQPTTAPVTSLPTTTLSPKATQNLVTLTPNGWSPSTIIIQAGQTVTWVNKSGAEATVNSNPHPVHTDYPPLNLGIFENGQSLSLLFSAPGRYGYHNHLNPSQTGMVLVR